MDLHSNPTNDSFLQLGVLELIQEDVAARLRDCLSPLFIIPETGSTIRILTERSPNYDTQVQEALQDEGLLALVLPLFGNVSDPNAPGPFLADIRLQINCVEARSNNKFLKSYGYLSETVLRVIHHFTPPSNPGIILNASSPTYAQIPDDDCYVCAVSFKTGFAFTPFQP